MIQKAPSQKQEKLNTTKKQAFSICCMIAVFICTGFPLSARADLPVIDPTAIANMVEELDQLKQQYTLLQESKDKLEKQLAEQQKLVSDSEGHYNMGNYLNGEVDLKDQKWSPKDWETALKGLSGGNNERYQQLLDSYQAQHPTLSKNDFEKGGTPAQSQQYEQQRNLNRAASVNASYAFNDIEQRLTNIHSISEKIESSPNTKASLDLSARLLAEIAYIQVQELKLQALVNQQLAQQSSEELFDKEQAAKFNTLPNS